MFSNLIDEIIYIDLTLASISQSPLTHRKFCCLMELSSESKLAITKSSLDTDIEKIVKDSDKELVKLWFSSQGQKLTVYNFKLEEVAEGKEGASLRVESAFPSEIEEYNIILANLDKAKQNEVYNKFSDSIKATKRFYFSVGADYQKDLYPVGRSITCFLTEDNQSVVFEYLAPYTKELTYRKNNFETSNLEGLKLNTLQFLKDNNLGALVYFDSTSTNDYYNIRDNGGFSLNADFLAEDLKDRIKNRLFTSLKSNNKYDNINIIKLDTQINSVLNFFKDQGLVMKFSTSYKTYEQQAVEDIQNQVVRGFEIQYSYKNEIQEVHINLQETLGE